MQFFFFLYFQYKEMKMQGLNNNLIYRPHCKKKETNQEGYQEAHTQPKMQGQPMKKMMRKKNRLKIQLKEGLLSLCRHSTIMIETQEDSTTIKTHPANTKLNNQAKHIDVRHCLGKNGVYTFPIEWQLVYVCVCQGKNHVYVLKHCQVKDKAKKLRFKMKIGYQEIRRQGNSS
jgi:hypothetical protein